MTELSLPAFAGMSSAVLLAYTVFGLTGFGSALVAVPIMVLFVPLSVAVPLVLLMDLASALLVGGRNWRDIARVEIFRLVPFMCIGIAIGAVLLVGVDPKPLLLTLGVFVVANALWSLYGPAGRGAIGAAWSAPAGVVGGVFGALFGTGGPVYTLYLVRRIEDLQRFHATIATMVMLSALARLGVFAAAGLYAQDRLLWTALALAPFCALGLYAGARLRRSLEPAKLRPVLYAMLGLTGAGVIVKALAS